MSERLSISMGKELAEKLYEKKKEDGTPLSYQVREALREYYDEE